MNEDDLQLVMDGLRWESYYHRGENGEDMFGKFCAPHPHLDPDFSKALDSYALKNQDVIEVGMGYGEQSCALYLERGLNVTGMDVSKTAVRRTNALAQSRGAKINAIRGNFLMAEPDQIYAAMFDRGCFTVLSLPMRDTYVEKASKYVIPGGYLFLKANGDSRTSAIKKRFSKHFATLECIDTEYHGDSEITNLPAKFFVFQRYEK